MESSTFDGKFDTEARPFRPRVTLGKMPRKNASRR